MFSFTNLSFNDQLTDEEKYLLSLDEMATIGRSQQKKILMQVNPGESYTGDSYFKIYNAYSESHATKLARIRFEYPLYVIHAPRYNRGKEYWWLNSKEKNNLIEFLNSQSENSPNDTNWQWAILNFNNESGLSFNQTRENLINGNRQLPYPNFLPFNLPIPDYLQLPKNERINEQKKQQIERNR